MPDMPVSACGLSLDRDGEASAVPAKQINLTVLARHAGERDHKIADG
jgi:hypothetical protein